MWTGDVQSGYPTQWALNPSTYQNLPNEQVDWASLAQQWIKMKETFPEPQPQVPPAPPPPSIQADIEAGEAPMDVTKDETTPTPTSSTTTSQDGSSWGAWGSWQQWGWGWGGPPDSYTAPSVAPPATTFDYNHGASMPDNFEQGQQGYWSEGPAPFVRNKTAPADWRPERAPSRRQSGKVEEVVEPDTTTLFDAAKRKQLPAWIREGLEKMEREKQKKLERERQLKEREEEILRRKQEDEEALASGVQLKSKFDTDSEESEKETEPEVVMKPHRRSRFDTASSPVLPKPTVPNSYSPPPVKRKSREEIMQDVMQQVRYVLTDILMTVTNEEMRKIAEEVLADFRAKAPASRLRQTPALTSLTGKLGLGIYDSDSEDSSGESDSERTSKQNGVDSDEELRERINRKKQEFARIERDIEHQVEQQEERDRERQMEEEEEEQEEEEEEKLERGKEMGQVEPKLLHPGNRVDVKTEEPKVNPEPKYEQNKSQSFTPERKNNEKESSVDRSEDSNSLSKSDSSSSRSSSSSRHKKSRKSSKRKKEKKSSKKKRKRSRSRSSDRRKSHKKSSHSHRYERERSRSRSRSRSRGHYDEYHHYRRHSSESSSKRRHHSYSESPDHSRGKRSSHRSRD